MTKEYPEIQQLRATIQRLGLSFVLEDPAPKLSELGFRRIFLKYQDRVYPMPVEDEYSDACQDNSLMLLQLVLQECHNYRECDDILEWARGYMLDAADPEVLSLYREIGESAPYILELAGPETEPISSFDMQLNAGAAQALRKLSSKHDQT